MRRTNSTVKISVKSGHYFLKNVGKYTGTLSTQRSSGITSMHSDSSERGARLYYDNTAKEIGNSKHIYFGKNIAITNSITSQYKSHYLALYMSRLVTIQRVVYRREGWGRKNGSKMC